MKRAAMKTPVQKMASLATFKVPRVIFPATLLKAVRRTAQQDLQSQHRLRRQEASHVTQAQDQPSARIVTPSQMALFDVACFAFLLQMTYNIDNISP